MNPDDFAERIKKAADLIGGQLELSRRTGISATSVNKYALGTADPSRRRLLAIANAANVSVGWLVTGEGPMRTEGERRDNEAQPEQDRPAKPFADQQQAHDTFDSLGMAEGMGLLAQIYSSADNIYIRAINANLMAFADAVKTKARAVLLEQTIQQVQVQMLQMQEQINELKQEVLRLRNENSDLKRELRSRGGYGEPDAATG